MVLGRDIGWGGVNGRHDVLMVRELLVALTVIARASKK